ncbi:xanthine dehydrogenase molybdenum-binding subunit [Scopulibacillus daqui]|uniref:Xanthine dehydrogenase molybdenum-binding subunit n=1 Tax=Scopulibacillus daqui TaxID=1469162 RepID=A0ABS2PVX9_9BACL|nr:FAD binding domain-containing protein [Scopulibacillus daqui]MBM7644214.1 xanthine dehydrogenase molybdenum-binding subunit [Scopulibacillus daqui]
MIGFDFEYYRPKTLAEAVNFYHMLKERGKRPVYYSGGTELITMARLNQVIFGSVIDIKGIPDTWIYGYSEQDLIIGSSISLTDLEEDRDFPLLSQTAGRVADRTSRNKITIGGNICGKIIYREAVLPFLLADSRVLIAGRNGSRIVPISNIFEQEVQLAEDEWIVQFLTDRSILSLPFFTVKKRKLDVIDYPLLTLAAIKKDEHIRVAVSGLCAFPFRSEAIETILNNRSMPKELRIKEAVDRLPAPVLNDWIASAEYRRFVFQNTLMEMFTALEGDEK